MNQSGESSKKLEKAIELCLDGVFSPEEFADSVRAFVGLVSEVSEAVSPNTGASDWTISVKEGSMIIRVTPDPRKESSMQTALKAIPVISKGFAQLESDISKDIHWSNPFDDKVLKYVRDIADLAVKEQGKKVSINSNGNVVRLSPRIAKNAHQLLEPKKPHSAIGNVEGELSTLTDRKGFKMVVYRSLDGLAVDCLTDDPRLVSEAIAAFSKRVSVRGTVKYNSKGLPTSVKAEQIKVFRPDSELTPLSEIRGILR
ncbi:MAG: hypothetical protein F4120_02855 [Rhodothermaceae bacterium]|nr:hypothetical protein [Rhodothermaceae bacterium]MYC03079.1 hypothetical protein [Rhodothermaceae bacterium]MYI16546.1 hypothetical protein [Rhodothermaceae bacterium]